MRGEHRKKNEKTMRNSAHMYSPYNLGFRKQKENKKIFCSFSIALALLIVRKYSIQTGASTFENKIPPLCPYEKFQQQKVVFITLQISQSAYDKHTRKSKSK
jgi:hypothetical protein